jgi:hypothetical protein
MYSMTLQKLSGYAYITYAVWYAARLYPSLLLGDVPIALSLILHLPPLGGRKLGILPAGHNMYRSTSSRVTPLPTAMLSASMPAKANARYSSPA